MNFDPRQDQDNLGTMVCWHRRYNLGDENPKQDPSDYKLNMLRSDKVAEKIQNLVDRGKYAQAQELLDKQLAKEYISLPLFLYDHSGITMNTTGFSCPWDSGQVGFIYVSKEKVRNEYDWKHVSPERIARIEKYLTEEVAEYNRYLTGEDEETDEYIGELEA
jgi:hypothetical protein